MKLNIRNIILSLCWGIMSTAMGYSVKTAQGAVVFALGVVIILILADRND
jgi:uncharacterized membrane protein (Fun14 family)